MNKIDIKPLSINAAWKGQRFKTAKCKAYQEAVYYSLPRMEIPEGKLVIEIEFGFSNSNSDLDNPAKLFIDVLQKKYGFNDNRIYKLILTKTIVDKGEGFTKFRIDKQE